MKTLSRLTALLPVVLLLAFSATAGAAVTVGEVAPGAATATCIAGPYDDIPGGPAADLYRVPTSGAITSWSTNAAPAAGQEMKFKVFRPLGGGKYLIVGQDGPRPLAPGALNTFTVSIPVQAGDLIGLNDQNATAVPNACQFASGNPADLDIYPPQGDAATGATVQEEGAEAGFRVNVRATLLPAPTISSISPSTGLTNASTSVSISGSNFAEVKSVSFGTVSASPVVNSESQITAVAPPNATAGPVSVTVTTSAGTATSPTSFTYAAPPAPPAPTCTVPRLNGKRLKSAKKRIRFADCRVGKLTKKNGATAKDGQVVKQFPKPGATVPAETKVKVTLAP